MKLKQTNKISMLALGTIVLGVILLLTSNAKAFATSTCAGVDTSVISCDDSGQGGVFDLLFWAINIMTAGVGILAVGGIVYASVKYASSGGNPEQTKKAKTMIANIVVGLIAYALMYTLINFLVPGGLFKP